jgi:hypothetical protein
MQHDLDLEEALLERRADAVNGHLQELPSEESPSDDEGDPREIGERRHALGTPDGRERTSRDIDVNALLLDEQEAETDPQGSGARG